MKSKTGKRLWVKCYLMHIKSDVVDDHLNIWNITFWCHRRRRKFFDFNNRFLTAGIQFSLQQSHLRTDKRQKVLKILVLTTWRQDIRWAAISQNERLINLIPAEVTTVVNSLWRLTLIPSFCWPDKKPDIKLSFSVHHADYSVYYASILPAAYELLCLKPTDKTHLGSQISWIHKSTWIPCPGPYRQ